MGLRVSSCRWRRDGELYVGLGLEWYCSGSQPLWTRVRVLVYVRDPDPPQDHLTAVRLTLTYLRTPCPYSVEKKNGISVQYGIGRFPHGPDLSSTTIHQPLLDPEGRVSVSSGFIWYTGNSTASGPV